MENTDYGSYASLKLEIPAGNTVSALLKLLGVTPAQVAVERR